VSWEHHYWFFDKAVVDPLLRKSWKKFLRTRSWTPERAAEFVKVWLFPEPSTSATKRILASKTLLWTIKNSKAQCAALEDLLWDVPGVLEQCPSICERKGWAPVAGLLFAVAVNAFLKGVIDERTMGALVSLHCTSTLDDFISVSEEEEILLASKKSWTFSDCNIYFGWWRAAYRWQTWNEGDNDYCCLGIADTKRFIAFLDQAWRKNWPAPRLTDRTREDLAVSKRGTPSFRDFQVAREFMGAIKSASLRRPCVFRYFGSGII
jgi:hypothetical protein